MIITNEVNKGASLFKPDIYSVEVFDMQGDTEYIESRTFAVWLPLPLFIVEYIYSSLEMQCFHEIRKRMTVDKINALFNHGK